MSRGHGLKKRITITAALLVTSAASVGVGIAVASTPPAGIALCVSSSTTKSQPVQSPVGGACPRGYTMVTVANLAGVSDLYSRLGTDETNINALQASVSGLQAGPSSVFSSNATYSVPSGVSWLKVELIGAGSASGGSELVQGSDPPAYLSMAGSGGALAVGLLPVGSCGSVIVDVGPGGTTGGGTAIGGDSSVALSGSCTSSAELLAGGGQSAGPFSNGVGGTASVSGSGILEVSVAGRPGFVTVGCSPGGNNGGGSGGATACGGAGGVGGGGAGTSDGTAGGAGGNGLVIITPL